ncbi:MAG: hypothetical protein ACFFCE_01220 [Promethearchaeota archaeon]
MDFIQKYFKIRFKTNYKLMIGVNIMVKDIEIKPGEVARFSIWDISNDTSFETLQHFYYKGALGAFLIFDISKRHSFELIKNHHNQIQQIFGKNFPFLLIGNGPNLLKVYSDAIYCNKPREFAKKQGCIYIENPFKLESKTNKAFVKLARQCIQMKNPTKTTCNL